VNATVQPSSNLVVIQASAPTASEARDLANAFAKHGAAATNSQARGLYAIALASALKQSRQGPRLDPTTRALESENLSRLRVLSTIASPAQEVKPAQLPGTPSSPRPVRDVALAGVLGVVLGLLAVYIRDSFDRRLRSMNEIESEFALPMLGHVRTEALGQSPQRGDSPGVAPVDWELFRILRRNLDFLAPNQPIRSVAVTSSLPEEGKSTVAAFLAFASAAAGKRTLLIECDLRRPVLAKRLDIKRRPGLSDYVRGDAQPADILQVIGFGDPAAANGSGPHTTPAAHSKRYLHELVCLTGGTPTQHPVEVLRSEAFTHMLAEVRESYDLVVLDTPPLLSVVDTLELLPQVDAAVICVRVLNTTRQQAGAGKAALKRLPELPAGLVITGTRRASEAEYGYYGYYG
jgi:Mrp family chromosome partitioning ATPase